MFCRHCGKELPDTAKFCRWCGKEVKVARVVAESQNQSPSTEQASCGVSPATTQASNSQPSQTQPQTASQNIPGSACSHNGGVIDPYIDKFNEKLANSNNPLLQGRGIENYVQVFCWVLMVVCLFVPFITIRLTKKSSAIGYSAVDFLIIGGVDIPGALIIFVITLIYVAMLVLFAIIIYKNKNTLKSNRNLLILSFVDLVFQGFIFYFVSFCNKDYANYSYEPAGVGEAVYISILAACVMICIAANAISKIREQEGKEDKSSTLSQES